MDDRHIVAIDLGTSKIAITVAIVTGDDIQIIYYKEGESDGIRASAVFNPARASKQIGKVIAAAEKDLGIKIRKVVVCKPKYEVKVENAEIKLARTAPDDCITADEIARVKQMAKEEYSLEDADAQELFGVVAQSFSTEDEFMLIEKDIEGMIGGILEGNFKVFIGSRKDLKNIDVAFKNLGIEVADKYFTPESTAKAVLYDSEMDNGVALIDFGAGVTSVSVYKGNVMRHYAAIPFGGQSITGDIKTECNINDRLAENIKLGYGVCIPEKLQNLSEKVIRINSSNPAINSKELPIRYLSEIITARVKEITEAILYEIEQSGCADDLKSGIVVTGGCADMANCCNLIKEMSGLNVRVGTPKPVFFASGCDEVFSTYATCSIGMILKAKADSTIDCAWIQSGKVEEKEPEDLTDWYPEEKELEDALQSPVRKETTEPETDTVTAVGGDMETVTPDEGPQKAATTTEKEAEAAPATEGKDVEGETEIKEQSDSGSDDRHGKDNGSTGKRKGHDNDGKERGKSKKKPGLFNSLFGNIKNTVKKSVEGIDNMYKEMENEEA